MAVRFTLAKAFVLSKSGMSTESGGVAVSTVDYPSYSLLTYSVNHNKAIGNFEWADTKILVITNFLWRNSTLGTKCNKRVVLFVLQMQHKCYGLHKTFPMFRKEFDSPMLHYENKKSQSS